MVNGIISSTHMASTTHSIWRCTRGPRDQKSTSTTRTPLKAW